MARDEATLIDLVQHARLLIELLEGYDRTRFLRDVLIHSYDRVDLNRVWDAAVEDVPALLATIEPLVSQPKPDEA